MTTNTPAAPQATPSRPVPAAPTPVAETALPASTRNGIADDEIRAEQLQQMAERNLTSVRSGLVGVVVVLISQAQSVAWSVLLGFAAIRLLNLWYHHVVCKKVIRLGATAALKGGGLAQLEWGLLATGCTWGLAAWLLPDRMASEPAAHFLLLLLVAINGVMINTTSLTRRAVLFFVVSLWGMVMLRALWMHDAYARYLFAGSLAYAAISLAHGMRLHAQNRTSIVTELHNRRLLDTVRQAHLREQAQSAELTRANQELATALERAHALASYDELTGLLNRRAFNDRANGELSAQRRHDELSSMAMVDLDHFKAINDQYSYQVGDEVLKRVATALQTTLRGADILARWGGEEFLIFMPRTQASEGCAAAERLRQAVQQIDTKSLPAGLRLTASLGVTEMHTGMTLEAGIARAERGLYAAKTGGINRICLAGPNQILVEVPPAANATSPARD